MTFYLRLAKIAKEAGGDFMIRNYEGGKTPVTTYPSLSFNGYRASTAALCGQFSSNNARNAAVTELSQSHSAVLSYVPLSQLPSANLVIGIAVLF